MQIEVGEAQDKVRDDDQFLEAVDQAELRNPETSTLLVGDSAVDVQTARNAGTLAAAVNYGFGTHDRSAHPADIYLDRLTDLVPLLVEDNS